jgi:aerobic-type carbon monoxide dehydrogenase small subunit (CoxS/CutS family)
MVFSFELNGRPTEVEAEPTMPLLWVLRDLLNLTGTKYGCGRGLCGACTVHVDGQAVRSCQLGIEQVKDRKVTTIEGLSEDGSHPLQLAWIELQVPQCGYCQAGQLMSAAALLAREPRPSRETVRREMSGNLCRCGTYARIERAVLTAAEK